MALQDKDLDAVLNYLNNNPSKAYKVKILLDSLLIPLHDAGSIVDSLEANGHIRVSDSRFGWPSIQITDDGKEFIKRTSYQDELHNSAVKRHIVLFTDFDYSEIREELEFKKLHLEVDQLRKTTKDYPLIMGRASTAHTLAIVSIILALLTLLQQWMCNKPD